MNLKKMANPNRPEQSNKIGHGALVDDGACLARVARGNFGQDPGRLELELAIVVTPQKTDKSGQDVRLCV